MKKITYSNPVVEITIWDKSDVITTSGVGVSIVSNVTSQLGDGNVTANASYTTIGME